MNKNKSNDQSLIFAFENPPLIQDERSEVKKQDFPRSILITVEDEEIPIRRPQQQDQPKETDQNSNSKSRPPPLNILVSNYGPNEKQQQQQQQSTTTKPPPPAEVSIPIVIKPKQEPLAKKPLPEELVNELKKRGDRDFFSFTPNSIRSVEEHFYALEKMSPSPSLRGQQGADQMVPYEHLIGHFHGPRQVPATRPIDFPSQLARNYPPMSPFPNEECFRTAKAQHSPPQSKITPMNLPAPLKKQASSGFPPTAAAAANVRSKLDVKEYPVQYGDDDSDDSNEQLAADEHNQTSDGQFCFQLDP